jgi:C1A family cysteine protease
MGGLLQLSPKGRRYGLLPSVAKISDPGFPSHVIAPKGPLPSAGSLTGKVGPTKNQGSQGSCDGHACSSNQERLLLRWRPDVPFVQLSPSFAYALERTLEGTFDQGDVGAMISSAVIVPDPNSPGGVGSCPLSVMPYDQNVCNLMPNAEQLAAAKAYPGGAYHSIGNNIDDIKSCILSDYSFVIGIAVYDSFESDEAASSGLIPYPDIDTENCLGGHALHCGMAYDDTIQCPNSPNPGAVMFQNSWDVTWGIECALNGEGGFAWLSYDFLMNPNLTSDVRLGHLGKPWA